MDPKARQVLLTAAGGGSHGRRSRLWTVALHRLSDPTGRDVCVCHVPPGTSTWHTLDQRWCGHRTENGRGRPRVSHEAMVHRMAPTTTATGRRVEAARDPTSAPTGQQGSADERAQVH